MRVLVTGSTGFLGRELIPLLLEQGDEVYVLTRRPREAPEGTVPIKGDLTEDLSQLEVPRYLDAFYHLAGLVELGAGAERRVEETNHVGTRKLAELARSREAGHFYYVSTAYARDDGARNPYERSKARAEEALLKVARQGDLGVTIFRPSILIANSKTGEGRGAGGMHLFARTVAHVHRRAELVRRKVEGTLRLPVLRPVFRVRGRPEAHLNLIPVDVAAEYMATRQGVPGLVWVTNPRPPTMAEVIHWMGEALLVDMWVEESFKATPIEAIFQRMMEPFLPYTADADVPSDLPDGPMLVDRDLLVRAIQNDFRLA